VNERVVRPALLATLGMLALGLLAVATRLPLLFPAIGASAAVMAFTPGAPAARPRNCLLGHAIGAGIGWLCVQTIADGLPHALSSGLEWPWMLSGAIALGLTVGMLLTVDLPHPPAAATTMIVGMGLLPELWQVLALVASAALTAGAAHLIQRVRLRTTP